MRGERSGSERDDKGWADAVVDIDGADVGMLWVNVMLTALNRVHKFREELCTDTLAYDMEFTP